MVISTRVLITAFILFFGFPAYSQEVVDISRLGKIKVDEASGAKQQIMDMVVEETSLESIRSIIGEEKTQRSKELIKNKIIKDSGKYILSLRGQNFVKKNNEYQMTVDLKLSLRNLRAMLLQHGLLYQMEGPPKVLPVIQMIDRVGGRSFGWWYPVRSKEHAFLEDLSTTLHKALREDLQKIGFFSLMPTVKQFTASVPDTFRSENLQRADFLFLGEYFKSSIVSRGQVMLRPKPNVENVYLIDVRLEALHTGNGRLMAEVTRTFETEHGQMRPVIAKKFNEISSRLAEDLSAQLNDAWKKGTFGSSVLKMAVVGKVSPKILEEFKKSVVIQVRDIKALRERLIEARRTTFEVDSSALPQQLAQAFRTAKFNGFKVQVENVSTQELTIRLESL